MEEYKGFLFRKCADGASIDILRETRNYYLLIAIVGSYDAAVKWVDAWHEKGGTESVS